MTETAVAQPGAAPKSLPARLIGVIFSPGETFRSIVAHPRWLGALAVLTILVAAGQFAFLSTRVGQDAAFDQQIKSAESWGVTINDQAREQMATNIPKARYWAAGAILVMSPIMTVIFAGIGYVVFTSLMGGAATFKQVMAVVTHAGSISVLGQVFTLPLNYARETATSATNLAVFLPFLDEGSLGARFFGMIDLFIVWWLAVLAIGFAVLYRRRAGAVFASFAGAYLVIAAVIAVIMRVVAGGQ